MKKFVLLYILLLFICKVTIGQVATTFNDTTFTFTRIDTIDGLTKNEIFDKAKQVLTGYIKSKNSAFIIDDKESGKLVIESTLLFPIKNIFGEVFGKEVITFNIIILCKDNKFKLILENYDHLGGDIITGSALSSGNTNGLPKATNGFGKLSTFQIEKSSFEKKNKFKRVKEFCQTETYKLMKELRSKMKTSNTEKDF